VSQLPQQQRPGVRRDGAAVEAGDHRLAFPGFKRRLEENIGAVEVQLIDSELRTIDDAASRIEIAGDRYAPQALAMVGRDAPLPAEA
jgi:hypothetical protein